MKQRPILFSTPMVKAILDGRKIQTRRVVKPQPIDNTEEDGNFYDGKHRGYVKVDGHPHWREHFANQFCPYGQVGDILWVRETWQHTKILNIHPSDDQYGFVYKADGQPWKDYEGWTWKPSIFMPREACRLFLKITDIRVERLQDISDGDSISEGVISLGEDFIMRNFSDYWRLKMAWEIDRDLGIIEKPPLGPLPSIRFEKLWASINGQESWDANPWVWVVSFEKTEKP